MVLSVFWMLSSSPFTALAAGLAVFMFWRPTLAIPRPPPSANDAAPTMTEAMRAVLPRLDWTFWTGAPSSIGRMSKPPCGARMLAYGFIAAGGGAAAAAARGGAAGDGAGAP